MKLTSVVSGLIAAAGLGATGLVIFAPGCVAEPGGPDGPEEVTSTKTGERAPGIYQMLEPPNDVPSDFEVSEAKVVAAATKRIIYMNKVGGTFTPGDNNSSTNRSSIPSFTATMPAYEKGADSWNKVMTCVKDQFAPFNIEVTDVDPGQTPHIECVMSGLPQQVGMGQGVGGVAPMFGDCSTVERAVVYVFTQVFNSPQVECEVAAQEIAHAIGLDHAYLCEDPMTYLDGCGAKKFKDETVYCGEYSPRACACSAKQNSVQFMLDRLGPVEANPTTTTTTTSATTGTGGGGTGGGGGGTDAPPSAEILSPAGDVELQPYGTLTAVARASDDVSLSKVELLWQVGSKTITIDCAAPPKGASCQINGDTYTFSFPVGKGQRILSLRATDSAGNKTVSTARAVSLGAGSPPPPPPPPDDKPSLSIVQPTAGTNFDPGDTIPVRVTATDNGSIASVSLTWKAPGGQTADYDLEAYDATTYGIDLNLSAQAQSGQRYLSFTATDQEGNVTTLPDLTIDVE